MDSLKSDIYIKLDGHVRVDRREVRLKDMASVYCSDEVLMRRLEKVPVFVFEEKDGEKRSFLFFTCMRRSINLWGRICRSIRSAAKTAW